MVGADPLRRLWQSAYLGWLLVWISLLAQWAASAPTSQLPAAAPTTQAASSRSADEIEVRAAAAAAAATALPTSHLVSRTNASFQDAEPGNVDSGSQGKGWRDAEVQPGDGHAGLLTPYSSASPSAAVPFGDEDEVNESMVSLVPLFILLASFLLIIVSCVVVCQRIRNSHKNRYHREEQNYRVQAAAYQRVVASETHRSSVDRSPMQNGKQLPLDSNGNIRNAFVQLVDDTGLAASVVTCVQPTTTGRNNSSSSNSIEKQQQQQHKSILIDRENWPQPTATSSCKDQGPSGHSGPVAAMATIDAAPQAPADLGSKPSRTLLASNANGHHQHSVTFAAGTIAGVRKATSLKCVVKVAPPRMPLLGVPAVSRSPGAKADLNNPLHSMDGGKQLRVAFFDSGVTTREPSGRDVKVVRMLSLPNSSSVSALPSMTASPDADVVTRALAAGSVAQRLILSNEAAPASHARARSNGHSSRKKLSGSSSPSSSPGPSSPRDQAAPLLAFVVAASESAAAAERKPADKASFSASVAAVKRRHQGEGRPARRRPQSAAPRLVGAGSRSHWRQHSAVFSDTMYDPEDGEDFDESDVDLVSSRRPGRQPLSASVVHRATVVGSNGDI